MNWQAVSRRILRHVSRHASCSRSPGWCVVVFFAVVGACLVFVLWNRGVVTGFFLT